MATIYSMKEVTEFCDGKEIYLSSPMYQGNAIVIHNEKEFICLKLGENGITYPFLTEEYDKWLAFDSNPEERQIICISDDDTNGYGEDISVLVQVTGPTLNHSIIDRTENCIDAYILKNMNYDVNEVIKIAMEHLATEGYECKVLKSDYDINL